MSRDQVQDKALEIILQHYRCGLNISMGVGKTRIALQHMMKNYNETASYLVVAPKNTIIQSWKDECVKMNAEHLLNHIEFTTYLSLKKKKPGAYDILYLDECHSLLDSHRIFLEEYTGKILGMTGTPPVYGSKENLVNQFCPMVYKFEVDDATDSNILNDYRIIVHMLPMSNDKNISKKTRDGREWYVSEASDYEYQTGRIDEASNSRARQLASIMRMKAMMEYPSKERYVKRLMNAIDDKCIIFANTQKQADKLCKHSYHSKNSDSEDNLELFSNGTIDRLSCVLQLSEGVSIPGLKQGIIMHAYGNERKAAQRIGRLLRLNPTETATCHILCYKNSVDEKWVKNALGSFSDKKIKYYTNK
jgi:superfamily II DNA or RNA helicase